MDAELTFPLGRSTSVVNAGSSLIPQFSQTSQPDGSVSRGDTPRTLARYAFPPGRQVLWEAVRSAPPWPARLGGRHDGAISVVGRTEGMVDPPVGIATEQREC